MVLSTRVESQAPSAADELQAGEPGHEARAREKNTTWAVSSFFRLLRGRIRSLQSFHRSAARGDKWQEFIPYFLYPIPAITSPFIQQLATTVLSAKSRLVHHINFFLTRSVPSAKTDCPSRDCPSCLVSNNVFSASFKLRVGWYRKGLAISLSFLWCFHQNRRM